MKYIKGNLMKDSQSGKVLFEEREDGKWNMQYWPLTEPELLEKKDPIIVLQGKGIYEGDKIWIVDKHWFGIRERIISEEWYRHDGYECFSSEILALQYIHENKPCYPSAMVDRLISTLEGVVFGWDINRVMEAKAAIMTFKHNLNASKND